MTEIKSFRRKGTLCGLEIAGHTGYAESGSDIVCAALSTLAQTLETGLTGILGMGTVSSRVDKEQGFMSLSWRGSDDPRARFLSETIVKMLRSVEQNYPSYVRYTEVEVDEDFGSSTVRP
ncbi:MAG TPA: ribosomal-processing cysteine protease Prp [Synergistales bacterium]|nr:ribosomal-processing cysteine protease Prp [Synergistales bacterium]HPC75119.1 ribosomal-processing cysteine protease Prp [Synergistales bacterium]HRS48409.1 ribosomal-processing cysteine protease Prp [Thermovirgaceae bacterium]HRU90361.1 ribosomal-processing cysteine protease Prp [Thermovirgaceae bacterium]